MKGKKWFFVRSLLLLTSLFALVLAACGVQDLSSGPVAGSGSASPLSTANTSTRGYPGNSDIVPGEVLVGFAPSASLDQMSAVVASMGGVTVKKISLPNGKIWRVRLSAATQEATDAAVNSMMKTKQDNPSSIILFAEPNIIQRAQGLRSGGDASIKSQSSDAMLWAQWGYYDIAANWLPAPTTTAPMVAVIDTGVDYTHPDLLGKVVKGYDFANADANPMDDVDHGTHVSGIIAANANNVYGITGVSWTSKILAIKVLDSQGGGNSFDISLGIIAAANNPSVKVINMSLGGDYTITEDKAVDYAVNIKGKLLVAAAGNYNSNTPFYPAALTTLNGHDTGKPYLNKVLAVAAHDPNDCRASFSNYGTWVSITAPGVDILSTIPIGKGSIGLESFDGTSMAAPFVSGAAAVAWAKFPTYTNAQIGALLTSNTASTYSPLNRDNVCWPADASTFERLNLLHVINKVNFEACTWGYIDGLAEDAENGEPLVGAKVVAKQGLTVSGTDYVPYYGVLSSSVGPIGGYGGTAPGLFGVMVQPGGKNNSLSISKTGYASPVLQNIVANSCNPTLATPSGFLPVPPAKPFYWLVTTWEWGTTSASYDSYLNIPNHDCIGYDCNDAGTLNASPYAKWLWDNDYEIYVSPEIDLRSFSETIRIQKVLPGTYTFEVDDFVNKTGSTAWGTTGITVYVYKWNPLTLKPVLVQTITPPAGAGEFWHVLSITGNTVTVTNTLNNTY